MKLAERDDPGAIAITCPTCRSATKAIDVKSLAQNFTLNRMLEILEIQESQRFECDECDEGHKAETRCIDCSKYMCGDCNAFHERRKATKGHSILTIAEFKKNAQELHRPGSSFNSSCARHNGEELKLYCETCETLICRDCTMIDHVRPEHRYIFVHEAGANHRMEIVSALKRTSERIPAAQVLIDDCDSLMAEVGARARDVEAEVRSSFQMHRWQLQQREEELVVGVRSIREAKEKILTSHRESFDLYLANLKSSCDFTDRVLSEGTAAEVLATKVQIKSQLKLLAERELTPKLPVESSLHFYANTQALSEAIESFASVTASSSFPPLCQAVGDGIRSAVVANLSTFKIITFDQQGEKRTAGGDTISVRIERPESRLSGSLSSSDSDPIPLKITDLEDGTYDVSFAPTTTGVALIHVSIQVTPISSSPFKVVLYASEEERLAEFPVTDTQRPAL